MHQRPGAPWQNPFVESFHSRLRDECFNREWFNNVTEARVITERHRRSYNTDRPHSSIGDLTPAEMRAVYDRKVDTENPQQKSWSAPRKLVQWGSRFEVGFGLARALGRGQRGWTDEEESLQRGADRDGAQTGGGGYAGG
jgi:hypothetical protein